MPSKQTRDPGVDAGDLLERGRPRRGPRSRARPVPRRAGRPPARAPRPAPSSGARRQLASRSARHFTTKWGVISRWNPASALHSSLHLVDETARGGVGGVGGQRWRADARAAGRRRRGDRRDWRAAPAPRRPRVGSGGRLERRQRLVRAAGVHGGQAEAAQQRRRVGTLAESLPEEQHGFLGAPWRGVPAPALVSRRGATSSARRGSPAHPSARR